MTSVVYFARPDGSRGEADLEKCRKWPRVRAVIHIPVCPLDGDPTTELLVIDNLDHHRATPVFFQAPSGEFFRRLGTFETPQHGLRPEVAIYVGVARDQAHAWLKEQGYDLPEDLDAQGGGAAATQNTPGRTADRPATVKPTKQPRNQGKGQAGFRTLREEWLARRDAPSYSELKRRHGWQSLSPAYAAYGLFYEWSEYIDHLRECPKDQWGPGPRSSKKKRR